MMGAPFVLGLWMVFTASMVGQAGPTAVTLGLHGHGKGFIVMMMILYVAMCYE
jgi:hypothetical protein